MANIWGSTRRICDGNLRAMWRFRDVIPLAFLMFWCFLVGYFSMMALADLLIR